MLRFELSSLPLLTTRTRSFTINIQKCDYFHNSNKLIIFSSTRVVSIFIKQENQCDIIKRPLNQHFFYGELTNNNAMESESRSYENIIAFDCMVYMTDNKMHKEHELFLLHGRCLCWECSRCWLRFNILPQLTKER